MRFGLLKDRSPEVMTDLREVAETLRDARRRKRRFHFQLVM
jgi:hypothetical protein